MTDVYQILCHILQTDCKNHDGSWKRVNDMLNLACDAASGIFCAVRLLSFSRWCRIFAIKRSVQKKVLTSKVSFCDFLLFQLAVLKLELDVGVGVGVAGSWIVFECWKTGG